MEICLKTSIMLLFSMWIFSFCAQCMTCPPGYWVDIQGTCDPCDLGQYCPGDSSYYGCASGTYSDVEYLGVCKLCPVGTYSGSGATYCSNCAIGTYTAIGSSSCSATCPAGYYAQLGGNQCLPCPPGFYSSVSGITSLSNCLPCGTGYYSLAGSATCLATCPAGSYVSSTFSQCSLCPAGTANPSTTTSSTAARLVLWVTIQMQGLLLALLAQWDFMQVLQDLHSALAALLEL